MLLGVCFESLPGETATNEIHEDVSERFEIVASALFNANVGVDAGVPCGPRQVFVFAVWNVLVGAWIAVLFGETEIDNVDHRLSFAEANEKTVEC